MRPADRLSKLAFWTLVIVALVGFGLGLVFATNASAAGQTVPGATDEPMPVSTAEDPVGVNETAYIEPVPEPGDEWYEASATDGSWISYVNPRDEYRSPYEGHGSGKIGITLRNESGAVIVGESVPNTTVVIPTGESLAWHSAADPVEINLPLTDHYERPLDADQFGTHEELPQGDGYLDSHTVEWHGLPANATVAYDEAEVVGEHADRIEVVGYIQQAHQSWDSDVDPLDDAVSYEEAGGEWTYRPGESHGQMIVVLQLVPPEEGADDRDLERRAALDQLSGIEAMNETAGDADTETTERNETPQASQTEAAASGWMDRAIERHVLFGIGATMIGFLVAIAYSRR